MSARDPRPTRVRGVGRDAGGVVLSIDVDGVHGEAGPPLKVVMTADEARLTEQLLREAAGRRVAVCPVPSLVVLPPEDDDVEDADFDLEDGRAEWATEGLRRRLGRHLSRLLGFRSAGGAADPRAPP